MEFALVTMAGWYLDQQFKTAPWLTVIGAFLGMGAALAHLFAMVRPLTRPSTKTGPANQARSGDGPRV